MANDAPLALEQAEPPLPPMTVTVDGVAPPPAAAPPPPVAPAPPADDPAAAVADLRRQLAERDTALAAAQEQRQFDMRAREEAERRAREAGGRANEATTHADEARYSSVVNGLAAAQQELVAVKTTLKTAMEAGDFTAVADANEKIGRLAADVRDYERGKMAMDEARKAAPVRQQPANEMDRRESYLSSLPARSAAWIRQHADKFFGDPTFHGKVLAAADYNEKVRGLTHASDEFFKNIEEAVGLRSPAAPVSPPPAPPAQPAASAPPPPPVAPAEPVASQAAGVVARSSPVPAAPPQRTVPTSNPASTGTEITLTPEEQQIARMTFTPEVIGKDGNPYVAFARQKAQLMAEGRWPPFGRQ